MYIDDCEIPARVKAALKFIEHARELTDPADRDAHSRPLTEAEARVLRLALNVVSQYFAGEMDYGDKPPKAAADAVPDATARIIITP